MNTMIRLLTSAAMMPLLAGAALAAETVILGATVMTMDPANPVAEAIAITGGRIVAVGSAADLAAEITPETTVYQFDGALVLPGFQDAHTHLVWSGAELEDVSLWDATSLDDLAVAIRDGAAPDAPWVRGTGWDISAFPGQMLTAAFLDTLIADRPAYFAAADGHSVWVNSAALELAGITADTPDPDGGRIERDASGAPQGLLRETATALVGDLMPDYSPDQVARGLDAAQAEANSYGITSIIDAKVEPWMLDGYAAAEASGRLTLRVRGAVEAAEVGDIATAVAAHEAHNSDMLAINAVKIYADGVIESGTANLLVPYVDGTNTDLIVGQDDLTAIVIAAEQAELQAHIHAIGDGAIRAALDAIAAARAANGPLDLRHQIAHLELIDPADIGRFAALDVIANFQPLWAYPDSYITDLTEPVIGPERSEWLYPIGAVLATGATVVGGSDWSVSSMNPLEAIQVAVTRQDPEDPDGRVLTPQHLVGVNDMIRAYTTNAAYAGFREAETGTLEVGKWADIVVLDRDITAIPLTEIAATGVLLTLLGGQPVFIAEGVAAR